MNYGETLTYWYLRLNGFFPLQNFVLHRVESENERRENADVDLLAVRFPHAHERINDEEVVEDPNLTEQLSELTTTITGLIVEVKTSSIDGELRSFRKERIISDIRRLGFFSEREVIERV